MSPREAACRAQYPPSDPTARIIRCHLEAGHPGEHEEADTEVTWTNDVDDARPAAEAGRADEDLYRAAAQAMFEHADGDNDELFEWQNCPSCPNGVRCACSGVPYPSAAVRAAIDAARAPLLAELAEDRRAYLAQVERLIRERDEARAKAVDRHTLRLAFNALAGAPNRCRYHGDDFGFLGWERGEPRCDGCKQPWRVERALGAIERAITGPVEPVTDDGSGT